MPIVTINPTTAKSSHAVEKLTADEVEAKLAMAEEAFHAHRRTSLADRAAKMRAAGEPSRTRRSGSRG